MRTETITTPREIITYAPDHTVNLPLELSGARIENNMLKADRPLRVGENIPEATRLAIAAAEEARLAEIRAEFFGVTSEPQPVEVPIVAR